MMVAAIVLAAGESRRMGQPKMLLPWAQKTVLEAVLGALRSGGVDDILVVSGGARRQVEALVGNPARIIYNPEFIRGEMLSSLQIGLSAMGKGVGAALISLGDQPQIEQETVRRILEEYENSNDSLIVPSYQRRRGHPWLVGRKHWNEILNLRPPNSAREFLNAHSNEIRYIELKTPSILQDLDTPEDYLKMRP